MGANPDQADIHNPDPDKRTRRVKGLVLEGYRGGPVQWSGGSVYDPQSGDEAHRSTLTFVAPPGSKRRAADCFSAAPKPGHGRTERVGSRSRATQRRQCLELTLHLFKGEIGIRLVSGSHSL